MATAVLIVNYRVYDELTRCIASLLPHLGSDDEVVVVDYESRADALARAVPHDARITTIARTDNRGFSAGVNLAAAHSRAPYLLLLNPDTLVKGPVVRVLEDWLIAHPDTGVVGARVLNRDGSVQPTARLFPGVSTLFGGRSTWLTRRFPGNWFARHNLPGREATDPTDVDWLAGSCLMTRRDVLTQVGGFDESFFLYWEDADYCRRVAASGFRRTYLPKESVQHMGGASADYDIARAIRTFHDSAFRFYWKYASPGAKLAAPIVRAGLNLRGAIRIRDAMRKRTGK